MQIDVTQPRKPWIFRAAFIGSLGVHFVVLIIFLSWSASSTAQSYTVNMIIHEVKPEPTPPPAEPTPPPKPKQLPPPNQKVTQPTNEPPKPVFGVTKDSVVDGDSGTAVRVGNTLMKEPEKNFTDPANVKPYSAPETYQQSELDHPPKILKMIKPEYPLLAKRANREGVVKVRFLVTKNGQVKNIKVLSAPEGTGFAEAAVAAVELWQFETPTVKGQPVSAWIVQSIRFKLE